MKGSIKLLAVAGLVSASLAGGAGVAAAQTGTDVGPAAKCGLNVSAAKYASWYACSPAGEKVRVTYTNQPARVVCVPHLELRALGYMPPVKTAAKVGVGCP